MIIYGAEEITCTWRFFVYGGSRFESEGTYVLDEANKKLKVNLEGWSAEKEYDYTLDGDVLDLKETYSSFHLIKQK